ncbi:MAG: exopolysaccharide biosynthesis polyprenyl glycosylphosphotransferase [Paramuribaculum sp.]|nr:exopolysaccharide biosynthesis polyprenyl glycosylphosphotransferase [Paramuribaculum sp.]
MTLEHKYRTDYVVCDFLATSLAVYLFNIIRFHLLEQAHMNYNSVGSFIASTVVISGQIVIPLIMMMVYYLSGFYNNVFNKSRVSVFNTTMMSALIGTLVILLIMLINDLTTDRTRDYTVVASLFILLFGLVFLPRYIITRRISGKIRRGLIYFPTLVVGYSADSDEFYDKIPRTSTTGMRTVALCNADSTADNGNSFSHNLPIIGIDAVNDFCHNHHIDRILLVPHPESWDKTLCVITKLMPLNRKIYVAAESLPPYVFNTYMTNIVAEPFIDISRTHLPASTLNIKRCFDVGISLTMLAITGLPILITAAIVKLNSPGPGFFKQERLGRNKRKFNIIKLRTMVVDAEKDSPRLSSESDRRITSIGRFLRRYHIDELPQFYNVLRGDMSLVGPRPERRYYAEQIMQREPAYSLIYRVRPGITSLGMVRFGYARNTDEMLLRLRYDLLYLENISIATDLKILLYTISNVFGGRGDVTLNS